ncbi:MAG: type III-B CRISPR module RAMP protein Cmr6 [Candidatus Poribacteria bacterium]|nr:type III-B CRISPR module RAMP protein Cmr6 [Candidatus Poribacteria bacterium]
MPTSYHPSDTSRLVRFNQIDNFSLRYHYFLRIDKPRNNNQKYRVNFQRSADKLGESSQELVGQLKNRQTQQLQQFAKQGIKLYCVDATVDWRLVVGLGGEHVQETSMTLHHIYGIPYIPGSAVKGVLRHWWFQELQEQKDFIDDKGEVDETKALEDLDYCNFIKTFGSQEQRGKVQFLDTYPEEVRFATDIMNPHYSDYYSGSKPPTDHQNPVLINFLTVEKTNFRFTFLAQDQTLLDKLKDRFQGALELKGIGAKTAVGYGYFRDFKDKTDTITAELKRQQEEVQKQRETERLASLSPIEQLAEELNRLTDTPMDENRAVQIYNEQLPSLAGDDKHKIAQALKAYWQRINKWDGGSDKQRRKVMEVKSILGES